MIHYGILILLFFAAHSVCDYPLQGDFLSHVKNRLVALADWRLGLLSHALIHAAAVYLVAMWMMGAGKNNGLALALGLIEFWCHSVIDYSKGRGMLTFNVDQGLHFACKLVWVFIIWFWAR